MAQIFGEGFLSMILALVSVMIIVATGYFIFRDKIPEGNKIAGMLIDAIPRNS